MRQLREAHDKKQKVPTFMPPHARPQAFVWPALLAVVAVTRCYDTIAIGLAYERFIGGPFKKGPTSLADPCCLASTGPSAAKNHTWRSDLRQRKWNHYLRQHHNDHKYVQGHDDHGS
jgi:hypothetical protein